MTLEIISGGAGSGKTYRCLDLLLKAVSKGESRDVLYLVFNNSQTQMVREFLQERLTAYVDPSILTYNALVGEILFRNFSPPLKIAPKNMALHLFHLAVQETDLNYYGKTAASGLIRLLYEVVYELKVNCAAPEAFLAATARLPAGTEATDLSAKATEVSRLYQNYQSLLLRHGYEEWPDAEQRAAKALEKKPDLFGDKKLMVVDGFFYLTPGQKSILRRLFASVDHCLVTVCYDSERKETFKGVEDFYNFLKNCPHPTETLMTVNRRARAGPLKHAEKNLFKPGAPQIGAGDSFTFHQAASQDMEVEEVARAIKRMVVEDGYDYTDFCILFRSDGQYKELIRRMFGRFKIPVAMSRSVDLKEARCVKAVVGLLAMAAGSWEPEKVVSFLRCAATMDEVKQGLTLTSQQVDSIENLALERRINEKQAWAEELSIDPQRENRSIEKDAVGEAVTRVLQLVEKLARALTPGSLVASLHEAMAELGLIEGAFAEGERPPLQGGPDRPLLSDAHLRIEAAVVRKIYELTDQFPGLTDDEGTGTADAAALLEYISHGAETTPLELPPEKRAGVWVSNVFEARTPECKIVFLPGLVEGWFPPAINEDPVFKDPERRIINRLGKELLPEKRANVSREKYLFYIAVTRASEKVFLTCPKFDSSGKEMQESFYATGLRNLFTDESLESRTFISDHSHILPAPVEIMDCEELVKCVAQGLWADSYKPAAEEDDQIISLYNLALKRDPEGLNKALISGVTGTKQALNSPLSRERLRAEKTYSISAIHTYGLCRFKYFCQYLLRLDAPKEYVADLAVEGDLYHEALRRLYSDLIPKGTESYCPDVDSLTQNGTRILEKVVEGSGIGYFNSSRGKNLKRRMIRTFERFLKNEHRFFQSDLTQPYLLELSFGSSGTGRPSDSSSTARALLLKAEDGGEAGLRGRIDRVDRIYGSGEKRGVVVIDYKRGKADITFEKMATGDDVRIPLYMLALQRLYDLDPIGGIQYSIHELTKNGAVSLDLRALAEGKEWGLLRRQKAPTDQDAMAELLRGAEETALNRVVGIREGSIAALPLSDRECEYCDYVSVCRYKSAFTASIETDE